MSEITIKFNKLRDYALWYYFRYYPSNDRLIEKLNEKANFNNKLVHEVIKDIEHLFEEENIIRSRIKNYLFKNKNLSYIKQKLREKKFDTGNVNKIINNEILIEGKSLLDKNFLLKKIENLKIKGKSKNYIRNKLTDRIEDKEIIENCILEIFGVNGESNSIIKELGKIKKTTAINKIIEKLLRKGFNYSDIKKVMKR